MLVYLDNGLNLPKIIKLDIIISFFSPYNWAKDGYIKNTHDFIENSFYDMPIVQIIHKDKKYFLSPVHIQITIEE